MTITARRAPTRATILVRLASHRLLRPFSSPIFARLDEALSFQTLNADGTPKRPMNAFLLYAVSP